MIDATHLMSEELKSGQRLYGTLMEIFNDQIKDLIKSNPEDMFFVFNEDQMRYIECEYSDKENAEKHLGVRLLLDTSIEGMEVWLNSEDKF